MITDRPKMYSLSDIYRERNELFKRMDEENWSESKFEKEERKMYSKYRLAFVAFFPVPKKDQETRSTY